MLAFDLKTSAMRSKMLATEGSFQELGVVHRQGYRATPTTGVGASPESTLSTAGLQLSLDPPMSAVASGTRRVQWQALDAKAYRDVC